MGIFNLLVIVVVNMKCLLSNYVHETHTQSLPFRKAHEKFTKYTSGRKIFTNLFALSKMQDGLSFNKM